MPRILAEPDVVLRALRRSRLKSRILLALREGPMSVEELAVKLETRPASVAAALHGALPAYAPERSVHRLGLVRRRSDVGRVRYALCHAGIEVARDIAARSWLYRLA